MDSRPLAFRPPTPRPPLTISSLLNPVAPEQEWLTTPEPTTPEPAPEPTPEPPLPQTPPQRRELTRDERIQVRTLVDLGLKYGAIAKHLGISVNQVQYANTHRPTPQKRKRGRHDLITSSQQAFLVDFVTASKDNHQMSYWQIPLILNWNCSESAICRALKKEGFTHRLARKKPPISETNHILRLTWAMEHLNWTREQWNQILWTDET